MHFAPVWAVFSIASKAVYLLKLHAWQPTAKPPSLYSSGIGAAYEARGVNAASAATVSAGSRFFMGGKFERCEERLSKRKLRSGMGSTKSQSPSSKEAPSSKLQKKIGRWSVPASDLKFAV